MTLTSRVPDLAALDLLLSVARLGSLGQAAREHGISQPSATARVKTMERLVGLALLDRSPRGSRLTPAGMLVADWARGVVEAAEALDAGVAALRAERDSQLRVAASLTVAEYLLPGWLVTLRRDRPATAVSLQVGNSSDTAKLVRDGHADVGFVEGPQLPPGLSGLVVARDLLKVVVAPGHPWARRRTPVPAAELAATPLIQREPGSGTRSALVKALARIAEPVAPLLELASTTAVKAAAGTGAGPAVLSSLAVADDLATGRLVAVPVAGVELSRRLRAVWPAGPRPAGPARDLIALATSRAVAY